MTDKINNLVNENTKSKNHNPEYIRDSLGSPINTSYEVEYNNKNFKIFVDTDVSNENRSFGQISGIREIVSTGKGSRLKSTNIDKTDPDFKDFVNSNHGTNFNDEYVNQINSFDESKKIDSLEKYNNASDNSGGVQGIVGTDSNDSKNTASLIEDQNKDEAPGNTRRSLSMSGKDEIISLIYPRDMKLENTQDHIVIEQFVYQAPQADFLKPGKGIEQLGTTATKGLTRGSNLKDYIGVVKMPIPNQLAISNSVGWGGETANPLNAGAFLAGLDIATNAINEFPEKRLGAVTGAVGDTFKAAGGLIDQIRKGGNESATLLLSSFLAQQGLSKLGIDVNPQAFIARGTGNVVNPNLELLFNGPKLRNFSFSFQFAPNDEDEGVIVRRIMRFFKQGMAPKKFNTDLIFVGSPNVFRLRYNTDQDKRIKGLNMFKICALTTCQTNFTPEGVYQAYEDSKAGSMPVRSTMTLGFTELTPIFESDYLPEELGRDASTQDLFNSSIGDGSFEPIEPDDVAF